MRSWGRSTTGPTSSSPRARCCSPCASGLWQTGDEQGVALVNCWLTELEARACNLPQASTYAGEAIAILDLGRHDLNLGYALFVRALTAAYEGD